MGARLECDADTYPGSTEDIVTWVAKVPLGHQGFLNKYVTMCAEVGPFGAKGPKGPKGSVA